MASEKVSQRMERWLAKADSHPLAKREADLALLLANDAGAWERYGQFYDGWSQAEIAELLEAVRAELTKVTDWSTETIHEIVANTAVSHDVKMGKVAQPLRVAVSGSGASPSIEVTLQLVGKWRTLTRIDRALAYINERVVQNS